MSKTVQRPGSKAQDHMTGEDFGRYYAHYREGWGERLESNTGTSQPNESQTGSNVKRKTNQVPRQVRANRNLEEVEKYSSANARATHQMRGYDEDQQYGGNNRRRSYNP